MTDHKLTVCFIGDSRSVHVVNRARPFAERGHTVHLVTQQTEHVAGVEDLNIVLTTTVNIPVIKPIISMVGYMRAIRHIRADLVHIHFAASLGGWAAAALRSHPLVVSTMGTDISFEEHGLNSPVQRQLTMTLLKEADVITAKSNSMIKALINLGIPEDKIRQVTWGLDLNLFRRRTDNGLRSKLGLSSADRVIFSPRILKPFYNIHQIIAALPSIRAVHSNVKLILTEYIANAAYKEQLQQQITALGLNDNVIFVGAIPHHRMPDYYSLADISIMLPETDGLPQALLEGLACETPTILADLPRYREFVQHKHSAYFVDVAPESVAEGVIELLNDGQLREQLAANGLTYVQEVGDLEREVDRVEAEYQHLHRQQYRQAYTINWRMVGLILLFGVEKLVYRLLRLLRIGRK